MDEYDLCLYGIFDGFQGCQVADFAKKRLPAELLLGQLVPGTPGTATSRGIQEIGNEGWQVTIYLRNLG